MQLNHFSYGNVIEARRWSAIQTLSENTAWSHVEGQLDKKRGAFSQRLTKKLEEPYNCARIKLTAPRAGCKLWSMRFIMYLGGSHDQEQEVRRIGAG